MSSLYKLHDAQLILLALCLALVRPQPIYADKDSPISPQQIINFIPSTTISGDPLTIHVAHDSSIQVFYAGQSLGQVYNPRYNLADSGAFVWLNHRVYAPDFNRHPGSATGGYSRGFIPWTTIAHGAITGDGSATAPWTIALTMTAGTTGLQLIEQVYYVNGNEYFLIDWSLTNEGAAISRLSFFHALDLYLHSSDFGYGFYDPATGTVGGYNEAGDWYQAITPLTSAYRYEEGFFNDIWDAIGDGGAPGRSFNNTIRPYPDFHDDGCGLQWYIPRLNPGARVTIHERWSFGYDQVPGAPTRTPTPTVTPPPTATPLPTSEPSATSAPTLTPTSEPREVPEAATALLLGSGLVLLIARARARRH